MARKRVVPGSSNLSRQAPSSPPARSVLLAGLLALAGSLNACAPVGERPPALQAEAASSACNSAGVWIDPDNGAEVSHQGIIERATQGRFLLLGEQHDRADHHRWQLHTMAAAKGRKDNLVLGFEMFPRSVQPALDRWIAGELTKDEFLEESRWFEVWRIDPSLYMPMFEFARQHRIPMVALNVDRSLVRKVRKQGWAAIPPDERQGISTPAPASPAYRDFLARIYRQHQATSSTEDSNSETGPEDLTEVLEDPAFQYFVEAQLTWDRAMAEALAEAGRGTGSPLVIGVIGRGHLEHGYGVPWQLADLGLPDSQVLLPIDAPDCESLTPGVAEAVFLLDETTARPERARPRLGVSIEKAEAGGVTVLHVVADSVAEAAALQVGDRIIKAAGLPLESPGSLSRLVQRQAPGTWLPLLVQRDAQELEIIAKFGTEFAQTP